MGKCQLKAAIAPATKASIGFCEFSDGVVVCLKGMDFPTSSLQLPEYSHREGRKNEVSIEKRYEGDHCEIRHPVCFP